MMLLSGKFIRRHLKFKAEEIKVWMTHIGGTPGHYDQQSKAVIYENPPDIFICGHSHIAKVMYDKKAGFLYINPGAAGYNGFHKFMTAIRFQIDGKKIHDLELIELGERGKASYLIVRFLHSSTLSLAILLRKLAKPVFNSNHICIRYSY